MRISFTKKAAIAAGVLSLVAAGLATAQMQPEMKTIKGTVIDLTCASKGHAMGMKWVNTKDDHMMEGGKMQKGCGAMCLAGGQPAGLFDGKTVSAVFACNPQATFTALSGKEVEVQGFWAGENQVKTFVPMKVREGSGAWSDVDCAAMHVHSTTTPSGAL